MRLVDGVAVEDVVAGVAAVAAARGGIVVGPGAAERIPAAVVASDPRRHFGDAREHVGTRCDVGVSARATMSARSPDDPTTWYATTTARATTTASDSSRVRVMTCPGIRRGRCR